MSPIGMNGNDTSSEKTHKNKFLAVIFFNNSSSSSINCSPALYRHLAFLFAFWSKIYSPGTYAVHMIAKSRSVLNNPAPGCLVKLDSASFLKSSSHINLKTLEDVKFKYRNPTPSMYSMVTLMLSLLFTMENP